MVGRQPTVVFLDDLHWGDEATLELLPSLADSVEDRPLLFLAAYQSDDVARGILCAAMCGSPLIGAAAGALPLPAAAEPVLLALAAGVLAQAARVSLRGLPPVVPQPRPPDPRRRNHRRDPWPRQRSSARWPFTRPAELARTRRIRCPRR